MELIGREAELTRVADRLRERRLVTLVGPGGIGKTALARAVVERCAADFDVGSHTIDLTLVDSAEAVRESLASQLGYRSFRDLIDAPGDLSVLLLLDNCEHVVDAAADAVDELLTSCQMPSVLATSRTALELPDELVVPIGPLEMPPAGVLDAPAVRLFVERAADAGHPVEPSDVVAELCRRLDGVPLAIELAAARTRAMAPTEILDRLSAGLDVLDRPRRRGARRHQSLRATIEWSYDLLEAGEQQLFESLGVFSGPFTGELAHAVVGEVGSSPTATDDLLDALVAASLVVADTGGEVTWYRELDTIRTFALDRLEQSGRRHEVEVRFVDHVVDAVTTLIEQGAATWSPTALAALLALYGNTVAVLRWCLANDDDPSRAYLLTAALWGLIHQVHTEEIGAVAELVVQRWPDGDHPLRADAIATAATCRYMLGDNEGAIELAEATLDAATASPYASATLRRAIAQARRASGDTEGGLTWFAAAADEARRLGLPGLAIESDSARAQVLADVGRVDEGLALIAAAERQAASDGSAMTVAWAGSIEGSILLRSDPVRAVAVLEPALAECRRLQYAAGIAVDLRSLALAALLRDDVPTAARFVLELLGELLARGSTYELRLVLDTAAPLLARAGRVDVAEQLAATARSLPVVSITAGVGHELFPLEPGSATPFGVRDAIVTVRSELEAIARADEAPVRADDAAAEPDARERRGVFRTVGDQFEVGLGSTTMLRSTKGLVDLARLLAADGDEVHCLELIGGEVVVAGDTGEVLDATARRAYEARVRELQADIDEADADNDLARADRARVELDALVDELTAALGLGGRARTTGSSAERARSTVTQRIRAAIRRLDDVDPRLARHLRASVRTGVYCSYRPEEPVVWQLD